MSGDDTQRADREATEPAPVPDGLATPADYVVEHAMTALACDPRVGALDIHLEVDGERIVASGGVETEVRRDAVTAVLSELFPEHTICNELTVGAGGAPAETEADGGEQPGASAPVEELP